MPRNPNQVVAENALSGVGAPKLRVAVFRGKALIEEKISGAQNHSPSITETFPPHFRRKTSQHITKFLSHNKAASKGLLGRLTERFGLI